MAATRRWLPFAAAAVLCATVGTASHGYAPRLSTPETPSSPPISSHDVSAEPIGFPAFTLNPRMGFFAAGDPINGLDPDGRLQATAHPNVSGMMNVANVYGVAGAANYAPITDPEHYGEVIVGSFEMGAAVAGSLAFGPVAARIGGAAFSGVATEAGYIGQWGVRTWAWARPLSAYVAYDYAEAGLEYAAGIEGPSGIGRGPGEWTRMGVQSVERRLSTRLLDTTFDPLPIGQDVLNHVVRTDAALQNVRLSATPTFTPYLGEGTLGQATRYTAIDMESEISSLAFRNRGTLVGTIAHEEMHLRIFQGVGGHSKPASTGHIKTSHLSRR